MRSVHNYITWHGNIKSDYSNFNPKVKVSYKGHYMKIAIKSRKAKWHQIFKENVGYTLNDSQYRMGNA